MGKIKDKLTKKATENLKAIVDKIGEQFYEQLKTIKKDMNISIDDVFNSTSDYNSFWELVAKYYNDYVDMTELEVK